MSASRVVQIPLQSLVRMYSGSLPYPGMTAVLFVLGGNISINALTLAGSGLNLCLEITSLKNGMHVHWINPSLFSFRLACQHLYNTFSNLTPLSLPFASNPTIIISSAMPKTLAVSLNDFSIFLWYKTLTSVAPNGSLTYQYLPNGQENVIKYDDFSWRFSLWYPELVSISMWYLIPVSLRNMSFSIGPLWIGLINVFLNLADLCITQTFPLSLGTTMKQLHHSDVSSTPYRAIICYFCSCSSFSFNGLWSVQATLLGGAWYGWLPSFTCKENVSSKQPIPQNRP